MSQFVGTVKGCVIDLELTMVLLLILQLVRSVDDWV